MAMLEETDSVPYAIKKLAGFGDGYDPASERVLNELTANVRTLMRDVMLGDQDHVTPANGMLFMLRAADKAELYGPHMNKLHKACQENLGQTATVLIAVGLGLVKPEIAHRIAHKGSVTESLDMKDVTSKVTAILAHAGQKRRASKPAPQAQHAFGFAACPC